MTSNERRLKKLRDLLARIDRLPPSDERERMLREVRARVVDVDTGVAPRAMLPTDAESIPPPPGPPAPAATRAPRKVVTPRAAGVRPPAPPPVLLPEPAKPVDASPLAPGELLSLGDPQPLAPRPRRTAVPWARGLRG